VTGFVTCKSYKQIIDVQGDSSMFTHHAQARMQSRSIPYEAVDALLTFGEARRHRGADVYYLDRRAKSRVARSLDRDTFRRVEKCLDAYVVVGDGGDIITAAHRQHRLRF
jgi:hypothetical protein